MHVYVPLPVLNGGGAARPGPVGAGGASGIVSTPVSFDKFDCDAASTAKAARRAAVLAMAASSAKLFSRD